MGGDTSSDAAAEEEVIELVEQVVIGSRARPRSVIDSAVPIDTIRGDEIGKQGVTDLQDMFRNLVPSYNVNTQPISDEATLIRPANLRGLAPDQTLVFVNGKRRHRAAVITYLGNGVSEGAQGPDISVIPALALQRVEVLRDTASAQYGSDAIAGVINFVLKDRPDGGEVEAQWGQTYEGDGEEYRIATNIGIPIAESGFANLSAQWHEAEPTVRSVQRGDASGLIAGGNPHVRRPYAQIWGAPDVKGDYTVFLNTGLELSEQAELYAFGNVARRETEGGFFFRNPNTRTGVFAISKNRLFGDIDPTNGTNDCPTATAVVENAFFDGGGNPECFSFNKRFPGGFTPQFKGEVSDSAGTAGFRGLLDWDLTYDVSYTYGRSDVDYSIRDTVNASLGPDTPTRFDLGSYTQTEQTVNLDLAHPVDVPLFASPLHAAAGIEWRNERFEIGAGERASWETGSLATQGFSVGANGYAGFHPNVAGKWDRSNIAGYIDFEADIFPDLTLATMGRIEHFDEFDTTTDFKFGGLYRLNSNFSVRGSAGTGFRAPTVGQVNASKVTTEFGRTDMGRLELRDVGTLSVTCPEAVALGAKPLEPEESVAFTAGVVAAAGPVSLTADVYNIEVEGRRGVSANVLLAGEQRNQFGDDACVPGSGDLNARYFGNGFDTRTQGIDIVASVDIPTKSAFLESGETEFIFAGNWTKTEVTSYDPEFIDAKRILQLEEALPKYRFNATLRHEQDRWSAFTRLNYFGPYTATHLNDAELIIDAGSEITLDAEISYKPFAGVELSIGAENILNNFPDENPYASEAGSKDPESSPMGLAGGLYYVCGRYVF
jgi:iron complex outermembrane receptor protein